MGRAVTGQHRGDGQVATLMNMARHAFHLDVPCPTCDAEYSKPCHSKSGIHYMPPKVHRPRKAASDALIPG